MITIFRMIRLWQLNIKWRLAIYQFIDKQLTEVVKHPESIEEKIMPYLTELIHNSDDQN
ncbi:MAG: hypothetical protein K2K63_17775 [Acetatifactor sp.]|nr:hypothetical protein [Acetatifactor sp.]